MPSYPAAFSVRAVRHFSRPAAPAPPERFTDLLRVVRAENPEGFFDANTETAPRSATTQPPQPHFNPEFAEEMSERNRKFGNRRLTNAFIGSATPADSLLARIAPQNYLWDVTFALDKAEFPVQATPRWTREASLYAKRASTAPHSAPRIRARLDGIAVAPAAPLSSKTAATVASVVGNRPISASLLSEIDATLLTPSHKGRPVKLWPLYMHLVSVASGPEALSEILAHLAVAHGEALRRLDSASGLALFELCTRRVCKEAQLVAQSIESSPNSETLSRQLYERVLRLGTFVGVRDLLSGGAANSRGRHIFVLGAIDALAKLFARFGEAEAAQLHLTALLRSDVAPKDETVAQYIQLVAQQYKRGDSDSTKLHERLIEVWPAVALAESPQVYCATAEAAGTLSELFGLLDCVDAKPPSVAAQIYNSATSVFINVAEKCGKASYSKTGTNLGPKTAGMEALAISSAIFAVLARAEAVTDVAEIPEKGLPAEHYGVAAVALARLGNYAGVVRCLGGAAESRGEISEETLVALLEALRTSTVAQFGVASELLSDPTVAQTGNHMASVALQALRPLAVSPVAAKLLAEAEAQLGASDERE